MTTLIQILDWLAADLATALSVSVKKGMPDFERETVAAPLAAVRVTAISFETSGVMPRIGQRIVRKSPEYELAIFARNEVELATMSDAVVEWFKTTSPVVQNETVTITALSGERYNSQTANEAESHAFVFGFSVKVNA